MKNLKMFNQNGYAESLSNLHLKKGYCVIDLLDLVEECSSAGYFCNRLNRMLDVEEFTVEKVIEDYVRLLYIDILGNRKYLKAERG